MKKFNIKITSIILGFIGLLAIGSIPFLDTNKIEKADAVVSSYTLSFTSDQSKLMPNRTTKDSFDIPIHQICGVSASSAPGIPSIHYSGYSKTSNASSPIVSTTPESPNSSSLMIYFADSPNNEYTFSKLEFSYNVGSTAANILSSLRLNSYTGDTPTTSYNRNVSRGTVSTSTTADPGEHFTKYEIVSILKEGSISPQGGLDTISLWSLTVHVEKHSVTKHDKVNPTCTKSGIKEYYQCADCGTKHYKNNNAFILCKNDNDLIIDPLGHKMSEPAYNWYTTPDHMFMCDASMHCLNDGCTESFSGSALQISPQIVSLPTSTTEGKVIMTAKFEDKEHFPDNELEITLPVFSKDSEYYKVIYDWAYDFFTDDYGCSAELIAEIHLPGQENYGELSLTSERAEVRKFVYIPPTCVKTGIERYVATFTKEYFDSEVIKDCEISIDPEAHQWAEPTYNWYTTPDHMFMCDVSTYCLNGCGKTLSGSALQISPQIVSLPTSTTEGKVIITAKFEDKEHFADNELEITLPVFSKDSEYYKVTYDWAYDFFTDDYGCSAELIAEIHLPGQENYGELSLTSEIGEVRKFVYISPTCVSTGIERYVATFTKEYFDSEVIKDCEISIDPEAHKWREPTYEWSYPENDVPYCTATIVCDLNQSHVDIIEGITYSQVRTIPTPATPGKIIYVAKFFDDRCEDQEITVDVPPLNPIDCDISYVWQTNGDGELICTGYATKKDDPSVFYTETGNSQLVVEKPCTCSEDGYGHYESTFVSPIFEKQISTQVITIPSPGEHVYYDYWVYDKLPTTTETGLRSHHCKYCDHFIDQETVPVLTKEAEKETAKSIIRPQDPAEEVIIDEALEKIPQESLDEITDLVNTTMNDLNEQLEQAKAEGDEEKIAEIETKIEITQAVTKSSVVISSEKQDNLDAGAALSEILPEDSPIDLENIFDDFIQRQMDLLLNKNQETKKSKILRQDNGETSEGINFDISAETYNNAIEFVDDSIEHMEDAATRIRECSCEELTVTMELYITSIQYSTFQDFDKEAADEEFVENAYSAIMLQMQCEVVTQLEQELQKVSTQLEKDPARENLIKEQIAAVQDMEQFEIMVMEILRQKYAVLTGYYVTLEEFEPVYRTMFRRWALNEEQDVDITLEELTTAVVDKKVNQDTVFSVNSSYLGRSEIILLSCLGGAFGALLIGVVTYLIIKKKKEAK